MAKLITIFTNYISASYKNALLILAIGLVFYIIGKVWEGVENNGLQLTIAAVSKVAFFICLISSCSSLLFVAKGSFANSFDEYTQVCRNVSVDMMGGEENFYNINKHISDLGINNSDGMSISSTTAKSIVIEVSDREMALIGQIGE